MGQVKPHAGGAAPILPVAGGGEALIEDPRQILGLDSPAAVADGQEHMVSLLFAGNGNIRGGSAVFDCVAEQLPQDEAQPLGIG
ncbi:hypothetical protein D3C75_1122260 [compost metagenome]